MDKKTLGKIAKALIKEYGEEVGCEILAEIIEATNKPTTITYPSYPVYPTITWGEGNKQNLDWTKVTCGGEELTANNITK